MEKRNNRFLNDWPTFFVGDDVVESPQVAPFDGQEIKIPSAVKSGRFGLIPWLLRLAGVVGKGDMAAGTPFASDHFPSTRRWRFYLTDHQPEDVDREFFLRDVAQEGWAVSALNFDSRTAVYRALDGAEVTVSLLSNWFDGTSRDWLIAQSQFRTHFGFGFLSSPALTGTYAAQQCLPKALPKGGPSEEFLAILHAQTTQGRTQSFLPALDVNEFFYYDRIFAYSADCYLEMPCGADRVEVGGDYVPFKPAFYEIEFSIPDGWNHMGLLPVMSVDGWRWPEKGKHRTFVAEPELRVAVQHKWPFRVIQVWRFADARPLELWRSKLTKLYASGGAGKQIFRAVLLQGLGAMYARSYRRERVVGEAEWIESGDVSGEFLPDGNVRVVDRVARSGRFYAPHWIAYTWSRARARLINAALTLPKSSILACHVDALYLRERLTEGVGLGWGQFRMKGRLSNCGDISMARDLAAIRARAEEALSYGE